MLQTTAVAIEAASAVKCSHRIWTKVLGPATIGSLVLACPADAADLALKAPVYAAVYNWTGIYVGGHVAYGDGSLGPGTNAALLQGAFFPSTITGFAGGYQAGYNWQLPNRVVLGLEADATFTGPVDPRKVSPFPLYSTIDYTGTLRGRLGYSFGRWMPYLTGGFAWAHTTAGILGDDGISIFDPRGYHTGWTVGLGTEVALSGNWSAKLEYNYIGLARQTYDLSEFGQGAINVDPRLHLLKFGLNYHFGENPLSFASRPTLLPESDDWNVHAQTTFLPQTYPSFRSPYAGANSFRGASQTQMTWTTTAFVGVRLWQGGEIYFNPELSQGFGLNGTLGLAGFSNGEAQKAGAPYPKIRAQRYYLKQTFGLGGEQEEVADGPNQLPGKRDIDRVTLVVGRFAVGDFFDGNTYAKDPRADFMNWAMWSSGAWDFPADLPGMTRGAVAELNRKNWAVRAGLFQVPDEPNSDILTFKTGGSVVEFEGRYAAFDQPGKIRVGAFANRGNSANYRQAVAIADANPAIDINDIVPALRAQNLKYGFYGNLEQQLVTDVGLFARVSWNDGQNEILSFTDIDRSVSGGLSVKGSYWDRPNDTFGIGGAINGLSAAHRDFLAAGGLGLLIGDGQLNYRNERILETYYAYAINKNFTLTADYQFITNPAYNADRGPVHIFSGRLHGEF